jgi:hypothetical protein
MKRDYYRANAEKCKAYNRKWYHANKNFNVEYRREYRRENYGKVENILGIMCKAFQCTPMDLANFILELRKQKNDNHKRV